MARLPPLLPTPPATLRATDADESRSPKRHRHLESPPPPESSGSRRRREPSPPPRSRRRGQRRARSPPYVSTSQRLAEPQRAERPSGYSAMDGREEGERAGPSPLDEALVGNRQSHNHRNCKHPETSSTGVEKRPDPTIRGDDQELHSEKMDGTNQSERKHPQTSSAAGEKRPDPAIRGDEQELHSEKMDGKNQSDHKAPSRNARRKWMRRKVWKEAKIQMREMKKDKLLENIKKLQDYVWLLEKEGADMAEIMEFRSLIESTKKQHAENEAQLAKEGPSASLQVQDKDRLEKTQVETVPAPAVKVERDEQNIDSGKVDGRSLKGCEAVSDENELAEEVNRLKSEIETVSQDRDYQSAQAQSLMADVAKQKEVARIYGVELEDAMRRVAALEEEGLLQRDTIQTLQIQIASANEKLTVPSST